MTLGSQGKYLTHTLLVWTVFYYPLMPWKEGLDKGKVEETLTLLTSLNYLHIPICHPDHSQGTWRTGLGKDERGRERTPRTWHSARESSMTCREEKRKWPAGISQSERQKSGQLFILAGAKRAPEQVVQPGASGATEEEGEKKGEEEEEDDDKTNSSSPNVCTFLHYFWTVCPLFFFPPSGTYSFAEHYYAEMFQGHKHISVFSKMIPNASQNVNEKAIKWRWER